MIRSRLAEHGSSLVVVALAAAFATSLMLGISGAETVLMDSPARDYEIAILVLSTLAWLFLGVAVYVAAVVITNAFATIVAGRRREIALLRLIGSSAARQRRVVLGEGALVGVVGSIAGYLLGMLVIRIAFTIAVAEGYLPDLDYRMFAPNVLAPLIVIVLTAALASWVGSRGVLDVTPIEAAGNAQPRSYEQLRAGRGRRVLTALLLVFGAVLIVGGLVIGQKDPSGILVSFLGGALTFTGVIIGAPVVLPPVMSLVGKVFGVNAAGRLAVANSKRYPERSARVMIALVIGVTLVVMFAVASETTIEALRSTMTPLEALMFAQMMNLVVIVFASLIGFSAVLAAIGTANTISLNVLQRTRELGLLRALGLSREQLRTMIRSEAALLAVTGILSGVVLGAGYGWVAAQSLVPSMIGGGLVGLQLPWLLLGLVVLAAALLIWLSSALPARRALRLQPVQALAER